MKVEAHWSFARVATCRKINVITDNVQFAFIPTVLITRARWLGHRDSKTMQSTFDPVGVATDWLDAYRAKNVGAIVALYADDAPIECRCDGHKTIASGAALTACWQTRWPKNPNWVWKICSYWM